MLAETQQQASFELIDTGRVPYRESLAQQQRLVEQRRQGEISDVVLLAEHFPVITRGARKTANVLLADPATLATQGIDVVDIRRGGGTTAHNPGQLVIYPIFSLRARQLSIGDYIATLETIGIQLLKRLGAASARKKGFPGLWVDDRKIASIGVRVSRQITYHGMAINISNDLRIFDSIVPCGLQGVEMTSLEKEVGAAPTMEKIKELIGTLLRETF